MATDSNSVDIKKVPYTDFKEHLKKAMAHAANNLIEQQSLSKGKDYFSKYYKNNQSC